MRRALRTLGVRLGETATFAAVSPTCAVLLRLKLTLRTRSSDYVPGQSHQHVRTCAVTELNSARVEEIQERSRNAFAQAPDDAQPGTRL